jgi:putative transposase
MRLSRLYAPGLPQLVKADFAHHLADNWLQLPEDVPYEPIVRWLAEHAQLQGVRVHAWSITPTAISLVVTPAHRQSISKLIQAVGRHLSAQLRAGSVFASRYRNAIIEPGVWVLPCLLWVEQQPLLLDRVSDATAWRWSSAGVHVGAPEQACVWLHDHHDYWACGNTPFDRQAAYKARINDGLSGAQSQQIQAALQGQWVLGSEAFVQGLAHVVSRRASPGRRGRPAKVGRTK